MIIHALVRSLCAVSIDSSSDWNDIVSAVDLISEYRAVDLESMEVIRMIRYRVLSDLPYPLTDISLHNY